MTEILDSLPPLVLDLHTNYFHLADQGFFNGRVAMSSKTRESHWDNQQCFLKSLGVDSNLQGLTYTDRV